MNRPTVKLIIFGVLFSCSVLASAAGEITVTSDFHDRQIYAIRCGHQEPGYTHCYHKANRICGGKYSILTYQPHLPEAPHVPLHLIPAQTGEPMNKVSAEKGMVIKCNE